jgi:16S rRNA C1402 N4-methylase RsmH
VEVTQGKILDANDENVLMAMDCDPDAGKRAEEMAVEYGNRFRFVDSAFQNLGP